MPVHDWTRVSAGMVHHFHTLWMPEISNVLNRTLLPADYYALADQVAGDTGPDVLTLHSGSANGSANGPTELPSTGSGRSRAAVALATAPPKVRFTASVEADLYAAKQRTLAIHHSSDDRIVALIEILSPGNKNSRAAFRQFLDKAIAALAHGYHLLLIDLQPPSIRDPQGIHGAVWAELSDLPYQAPPDKPLTLAGYAAGPIKKAFIEPVAVGDSLPDMPLFLETGSYVPVPLEATYQAAWEGVPRRWQTVLEP